MLTTSAGAAPGGLATERRRLACRGLSAGVISTIQCARAISTSKLYAGKWAAFTRWCEREGVDPECMRQLFLLVMRASLRLQCLRIPW